MIFLSFIARWKGGWIDGRTDGLGEWAGVALITAGYPSMPQYTFDMFNRNLTYSCMVNYFKKKNTINK